MHLITRTLINHKCHCIPVGIHYNAWQDQRIYSCCRLQRCGWLVKESTIHKYNCRIIVSAWSSCLWHFANLCHLNPLRPSGSCGRPRNIFAVFFKGTFPHNGGSNFLLTVRCAAVATNLDKLGVSFNLLIGWCCDSGYPSGTVIDWLLWCSCENPNSAVSAGDVRTSKPGVWGQRVHQRGPR